MKKKVKTARRSRETQSTNGAGGESGDEIIAEHEVPARPRLQRMVPVRLSEDEKLALAMRLIAKKEKLEETLAALTEKRASVELEISEVAKEVYEKLGSGSMTRHGETFSANMHRGYRKEGAPEAASYYFRNHSANVLSLD